MAGKPPMANASIAALPPKRDRVKRPVDGRPAAPLEKEVLAAVGELLNQHPAVLLAVRQNSGSLVYENGAHALVPVWFYKLVKKPGDITITDYWGFLRSGKPFAFECKRQDWKRDESSKRERAQAAFLEMIECIGGISRFVTDARQVEEALR